MLMLMAFGKYEVQYSRIEKHGIPVPVCLICTLYYVPTVVYRESGGAKC